MSLFARYRNVTVSRFGRCLSNPAGHRTQTRSLSSLLLSRTNEPKNHDRECQEWHEVLDSVPQQDRDHQSDHAAIGQRCPGGGASFRWEAEPQRPKHDANAKGRSWPNGVIFSECNAGGCHAEAHDCRPSDAMAAIDQGWLDIIHWHNTQKLHDVRG